MGRQVQVKASGAKQPALEDILRGALAVNPKGMPKSKDRKPRKKKGK